MLPASISKEKADAIRAEVESELKNKKQCAYQSYQCSQLSLDKSTFCFKHILNDKAAPYSQCLYVFPSNGKRCHLPTLKSYDKKDLGFCNEHALKTTITRNSQNTINAPPQTPEVLLNSLSHYIKPQINRAAASGSLEQAEEDESKPIKRINPFVDIDAAANYNAVCKAVLDYGSESESDVEASTYGTVWHDAHIDSSDNESYDSDQDQLKHANVYTEEEITLLTRDKLVRLQNLYIEQYRQLQHVFKERRRKYLHALKREKETCCNIYSQVRDNPKEQRLYKKLKYMKNYHKHFGVEAILNKRLHDLQIKISEGTIPKPNTFNKCAFSEGGVKCGEKSLPVARHCRKHILEDANQVLFQACGKVTSDIECSTPIEAIYDEHSCKLHMEIPPLRSYNQTRKDSDSDLDDSAEFVATSGLFPETESINSNVKTQLTEFNLPAEILKMDKVPSILFEDDNIALANVFGMEEVKSAMESKDEQNDTKMEVEIDESISAPIENISVPIENISAPIENISAPIENPSAPIENKEAEEKVQEMDLMDADEKESIAMDATIEEALKSCL